MTAIDAIVRDLAAAQMRVKALSAANLGAMKDIRAAQVETARRRILADASAKIDEAQRLIKRLA